MRIVAVALLDHQVMGREVFIVQQGEDEVVHYEVTPGGKIDAVSPVLPLISVMASIEKFNHGYLLDTPVELSSLSELPGYIGQFEAIDATNARRITGR